MNKKETNIDVARDSERILRAMNRAIRAAIGVKPKRKAAKPRKPTSTRRARRVA